MTNVYQDSWASIIVFCRDVMAQLVAEDPTAPSLELIDWEAHGHTPELPNKDLLGPLSVQITEYDKGFHQITFAIGTSAYTEDAHMFRQRRYINALFNRLRTEERIPYFSHAELYQKSVLQIVPGTFIAPMTEVTVRPFQFVQATALLQPDARPA